MTRQAILVALALLAPALACSEPQPERYDCAFSISCNGHAPLTVHETKCGTLEDVRLDVQQWEYACSEETGFFGCTPWLCRAKCEPTMEACVPSDAGGQ